MIRKKNSQKKKELRRRLFLIITLIILCLMLLFSLSYTIRNAIICNNIKTGNLMQYVGEFEVQKTRRARITIYFVTLGNRDVIRINPNLLNPHCDLTQLSELRFTYSAPEFGFTRAYTCVQVANLDNSESYLDMDISYDEAIGCVYLGVVVSALLIVILIVLIMPIPKKLFKAKRQKKDRGRFPVLMVKDTEPSTVFRRMRNEKILAYSDSSLLCSYSFALWM